MSVCFAGLIGVACCAVGGVLLRAVRCLFVDCLIRGLVSVECGVIDYWFLVWFCMLIVLLFGYNLFVYWLLATIVGCWFYNDCCGTLVEF